MGTQNATRSQILIALRRSMPQLSLRRLGDLVDGAKLLAVEAKTESSVSLAFGLVLEGTLRVTVASGQPRWIGPGEVFGMSQYELNPSDTPVLLTSTIRTVRYLAFSHENVALSGFARALPPKT